MIPAQDKNIYPRKKQKLENKVKILNPILSNTDDMGVLSEYVQAKRHLWGKSQECSGSLGKEEGQVVF